VSIPNKLLKILRQRRHATLSSYNGNVQPYRSAKGPTRFVSAYGSLYNLFKAAIHYRFYGLQSIILLQCSSSAPRRETTQKTTNRRNRNIHQRACAVARFALRVLGVRMKDRRVDGGCARSRCFHFAGRWSSHIIVCMRERKVRKNHNHAPQNFHHYRY
jgi:hypothetical protein